MKQSFIIWRRTYRFIQFLTLIEYNHERIDKVVYFHTPQSDKQLSSVAIIMNPTTGKQFQAMYMMLNALKYPYPSSNKNLR